MSNKAKPIATTPWLEVVKAILYKSSHSHTGVLFPSPEFAARITTALSIACDTTDHASELPEPSVLSKDGGCVIEIAWWTQQRELTVEFDQDGYSWSTVDDTADDGAPVYGEGADYEDRADYDPAPLAAQLAWLVWPRVSHASG